MEAPETSSRVENLLIMMGQRECRGDVDMPLPGMKGHPGLPAIYAGVAGERRASRTPYLGGGKAHRSIPNISFRNMGPRFKKEISR